MLFVRSATLFAESALNAVYSLAVRHMVKFLGSAHKQA
nr:MAG TPA: hypothetical protein [Caudoviricetes sp.]